MSNALPTHAQFVIGGGGIIGLSVAYHLAQLGQFAARAALQPFFDPTRSRVRGDSVG